MSRLAVVAVLAAFLFGGCGGKSTSSGGASSGTTTSTSSHPPPAAEVQKAVVSIINTCIKRSYDETVSVGPVSDATDTLIRFAHTYSLDVQMEPSELKAHTLRQAISNARDTLRRCSPDDGVRLDAVLSSP
jgi:hypothetical protein